MSTDQCTLYRQATSCVKQTLGRIARNEEAYYDEHHNYTDNRSDIWIDMMGCSDEVTIDIQLGNNGQSYIAKGTHPILDCVWTVNEKSELVKVPK